MPTPTNTDGDNINNGISGGNSSSNYSNNSIGNCDTNEKHPAGPTQENPPPESPTDLMFLNSLIDEVRTELNRLDVNSLLIQKLSKLLLIAHLPQSKANTNH